MADVNEQEILEVSAKSRFDTLDGDRATILDEARVCSQLTLPYLLPPQGHTETTILDNPYQNTGARLVNNLANKITFTMLPPNTPFFRLLLTDELKDQFEQEESGESLARAEQIAVAIENKAQHRIAKEYLNVPTVEAFKSLVVTGNSLLVKQEVETPMDKGLKSYRLDNYVVNRDYRGNVLEIVTRETVSPHVLPEDIQEQLEDFTPEEDDSEDVNLYTRAVYKGGKWYEYQYVEDVLVEDSLKTYSPEDFPYIPLRWTSVNGHNYGVGLVAQHKSDFITLEGAYQMLLEATSVAGKIIFGVVPGSQIDIDAFTNARNGEIIQGDFNNELTVARVEKNNDLSLVLQLVDGTTRRLEQVFLSAQSAVRDSERTTLGEIRYLANDLEQSLGGVYSILSQEYQVPLARLILKALESAKNSQIDAEGFEFVPLTGIEALGRNNDLDKLRQFSMILQETPVLQESIGQYFNVSNYIEDVTIASNLPSGRYIKTPEQMQQEQAAAQEQQLMMQGAQNVVQGATTPQQQGMQ